MAGSEIDICGDEDTFNPVFSMGTQMFCLLVIAQLFQLVLKPLGQPGPIAQILAGVVLGPTALSNISFVRDFFLMKSSAEYYKTATMVGRQIIMFMMGLQMDIPSMRRHLRPSLKVTLGSIIAPSILGAAISPYIVSQVATLSVYQFTTAIIFMLIIANTASPLVVRMVSELKLTSTRLGQLATYSSLINDMFCLIMLVLWSAIASAKGTAEGIGKLIGATVVDLVVTFLFNRAAIFVNNSHRERSYLTNAEVLFTLAVFIVYANVNESLGQNSMLPCFFVGLMLPRDGKTTRTLLLKLSYPVYVFVLPIYFGYIGFQADILNLWNLRSAAMMVAISAAIIGGKIGGTLLACRQLKIPPLEGLVLALLLCIKGFTDLLVIDMAAPRAERALWYSEIYRLFLAAILINTLIAGFIATFILNTNSRTFGFRHVAIEVQSPESELIILSCVHNPRHVWTMVGLIGTLTGSEQTPVLPTLVQLIELPATTNDLTFNEQDEEDEELLKGPYGNDAVEINDAVDDFVAKTGVTLREGKIVSPYTSMYEDVCNLAEDLHSSVIILSFHKHQRIDGRMESDKREGIRTTNQKILRHAPCSVAILVDKGGTAGSLQVPVQDFVQQVATLFFGGPDDREALAYSRRIGVHPHVNLTVIRFVYAPTRERDSAINIATAKDDEDFMSISTDANERDMDSAFISDFFNRYVTSGQIGFVEKYVNHGADTVSVLKDMGDMYSLFIVGKGGRDDCPMTTGLSDWEECPELGKIGDLLASSDLYAAGSILVIQQRSSTSELPDD
uniref:Cation/H+ exchanger domain-containing protein n=1 Tax=Kalanchoe fedtschenkoi TaxID=63787 RepID=A0A7N1A2A7_KALFE